MYFVMVTMTSFDVFTVQICNLYFMCRIYTAKRVIKSDVLVHVDNGLTKMLVFLAALCLVLSVCSGVGPDLNPLLDAALRDNSLKRLDQCLCEVGVH